MANKKSEKLPLEAALESSQEVVKRLAQSEILADIPGIGLAFKICKAVDSIRDRLFLAKLATFMEGLESLGEEGRSAWRKKMAADPEETQRTGEALLLVIDNLTEVEKAEIASYLFVSYLDLKISAPEFRRLLAVIDKVFLDDIKGFFSPIYVKLGTAVPLFKWEPALVAAGLLIPSVEKPTIQDENKRSGIVFGFPDDNQTGITYQTTQLGDLMRKAYMHGFMKVAAAYGAKG